MELQDVASDDEEFPLILSVKEMNETKVRELLETGTEVNVASNTVKIGSECH